MRVLIALHHVTRVVAFAAALFLVIAILSPSLGGYRPTSLSAYHPFFMTIGMVLLLSLGVVSYVSDYGRVMNARFPDRVSRRLLHGALQGFGTMFILVGYLTRFTSTQAQGKSHIAAGDSVWRQVHVWMGIVVIAGILLQTVVGMYKYIVRTREGSPIMKWHGYLGLTIWCLGLVTISVSVYGELYAKGGNGPTTAIVIWILLGLLLLLTFITVFKDPSRKSSSQSGDDSLASSSLAGLGYYDHALGGRGVGGSAGMLMMEDNSFDGPRGSLGSVNHKPPFSQQLLAPA